MLDRKSTVGYCSTQYEYCNYVAEMRNALSCFLFVLLPIYGYLKYRINGLGYMLLATVGISSAVYHSNNGFIWQMADEISICLLILYVVYKVGQVRSKWLYAPIPMLFIYPHANRYILFLLAFLLLGIVIRRGIYISRFAQILAYSGVICWIIDSYQIICIHDWWHLLLSIVGYILCTPQLHNVI